MSKNVFIEGLQGTGKSTLLTRLGQALPDYQVYREGDISPVELAWCSYMAEEIFQQTLQKYPQLEEELRKWTISEVQKDDRTKRYITAYTRILAEQRAFYEYMEQYEIYNGRVSYKVFHDTIMKRYAAFAREDFFTDIILEERSAGEKYPESTFHGNKNIFECSFFQNSMECMMLYYQMADEEIIAFYREAFEILKTKGFLMLYLDSHNVRENTLQIKKERCDDQGNEMWYPLMLNYLKESPYGKVHNYQGLDDMVAHFERRRNLELRIISEVLGDAAIVLQAKNYNLHKITRILNV